MRLSCFYARVPQFRKEKTHSLYVSSTVLTRVNSQLSRHRAIQNPRGIMLHMTVPMISPRAEVLRRKFLSPVQGPERLLLLETFILLEMLSRHLDIKRI
jgi:hypothetical protein